MAYRVVADHIRTLTYAITDGAVPDKDGRGYVLRRVLRRAVRYGRDVLGAPANFFHKLVPVVVDLYGEAFPELVTRKDYVMEIIAAEERKFGLTLSKGLRWFNKFADAAKESGSAQIPGRDAFFLYDSQGFPYDLTVLMAEERGLSVDRAGYDAAMTEQQERSTNVKWPCV